ncbi:MAG: hypothetical protein COW44_08360 [Flavobacteriaceae bacterium CG17_big_fil_post_rev_8_21_14_2_50_33_15]|nr:MAG: hypothetical protein COW44_08360 [Flavobacteriaceae bacterium CG17_big_fil_post_rev_8_21_14_2_50_33_15]PJB20150.1 MAG: hypothetical protein CO117_01975 [Flavobacteriaceae bacterium CG_4_9_14_3_um_filter_33_16]
MKSKFFKIVLPAFAILLAISLSFATESNRASQIGYYNHPVFGATPVIVNCDAPSGPQCLHGQYPVFAEEALETPLFKNVP